MATPISNALKLKMRSMDEIKPQPTQLIAAIVACRKKKRKFIPSLKPVNFCIFCFRGRAFSLPHKPGLHSRTVLMTLKNAGRVVIN
jgi:hypothetical protein